MKTKNSREYLRGILTDALKVLENIDDSRCDIVRAEIEKFLAANVVKPMSSRELQAWIIEIGFFNFGQRMADQLRPGASSARADKSFCNSAACINHCTPSDKFCGR